jgi:tetratricopeptide (TPR) repeat protein
VFYNWLSNMRIRRHPSLVSLWPLMVILLAVCAWAASAAFSQAPARTDTTSGESFARTARRALAHGREAEADALARRRPPDDPAAAAVLACISIRHGRHDEAIAILEPAAAREPLGDAALELGLLQQDLGRSEAATRLLTAIAREGAGATDAESLLRAARASAALGAAREANALFRAASAVTRDPAIDTAWGLLFLKTYNRPEAVRSFQQAIKGDADWAPAHAGLARTLFEDDPPAAAVAATRALEIDPQLADAQLLLVDLELDNGRFDAAHQKIDAVLAINPSHLTARAMLAGIAYVRDDRAAFDAEVRRVLAINPAYGEVYRVAGSLAARNYRFDEAVALTQRAVALDPTNSAAFGDLGIHLMRTGDEVEARRALDRAFKADPYDIVTYNLLALLDTLDKFVVVHDGDLIFKFDAEEAPVLREYAIPLAHEALRTLSAKYEFTPKGPILIEIFSKHDDFAVRNLGLPGMIGALGACFGRVVTLDSPRVRPPGTYSWESTLWHELAHVITLQMSNQRIPRWLTEGISVYEEGRAKPEWGRDMEIRFAQALERADVLKLRDLNSGFTNPDTIALAYYEAALLVDHIVTTYGEPALRALVRTYSDGLEGDKAVAKTIGVTLGQLQASFDTALDARFGALRAALRTSPGPPVADAEGESIPVLRQAAAAHPGSYAAQLALGRALAARGDRAAFEPLEKAAALVPMAAGDNSPHALMAKLAVELGDTTRAIAEYQALLASDHTAVQPARELAALAEKANDRGAARFAYDRVVAIDPFDAQGHIGLGRLALSAKQPHIATREFKAALVVGAPDRAAAHCDLGESYLLDGRAADAKREALAALEIAPSFERAQDLLLKAVDAAGKDTKGGAQ